jgi:hypothetical protein
MIEMGCRIKVCQSVADVHTLACRRSSSLSSALLIALKGQPSEELFRIAS